MNTPHHWEDDSLSLAWSVVPWDTEIFGFTVAAIDAIELKGSLPQAGFRHFDEWCRQANVGLVSCRLRHDRLRESGYLERIGFRFIEVVHHPVWRDLATAVRSTDDFVITPATHIDLSAVEDIAGAAFTTGRFILDPWLDPALNGQRYRRWVRSSFTNPRHQVLVAKVEGDIAGFFVVEQREDQSIYWHLTAIAPQFQGRGVGRAVWQAMLDRHRDAGLRAVRTTISAHNTAVLNLYAGLGFRFETPEMTYHRTTRAGDPAPNP
jgi:ribosomal protein S18 acetylase RimI-like enzyme